jgi:hypothetical protein|tara:strand:+ start:586 stop:1242 length:657 start_codon:yes stop_codon:yes gene_type:complete
MPGILDKDKLPNEGLKKLAEEAPEVVKRMGFDEGGVAIMIAPKEEPKEEMPEAEPMKSDEQMENDYLDFVVEESLSESEEKYLLQKLEEDDRLSEIFDKVMDVATEFAGSGPVEGPGSGVSDSIPARLSDGEFVFTAKATQQIGPEVLQRMMEEAEMEADAPLERQARRAGGYMMDDVREETILSNDPEKTYDLNKAEVEDTEKRIADAMISGGIPIR